MLTLGHTTAADYRYSDCTIVFIVAKPAFGMLHRIREQVGSSVWFDWNRGRRGKDGQLELGLSWVGVGC